MNKKIKKALEEIQKNIDIINENIDIINEYFDISREYNYDEIDIIAAVAAIKYGINGIKCLKYKLK